MIRVTVTHEVRHMRFEGLYKQRQRRVAGQRVAALAGMLVFIDLRLAHPEEFIHAAYIGKEEVFYMVATTMIVVSVDRCGV